MTYRWLLTLGILQIGLLVTIRARDLCGAPCVQEIYRASCGGATCITGTGTPEQFRGLCSSTCGRAISSQLLECLESYISERHDLPAIVDMFSSTIMEHCDRNPFRLPPSIEPPAMPPIPVPAPQQSAPIEPSDAPPSQQPIGETVIVSELPPRELPAPERPPDISPVFEQMSVPDADAPMADIPPIEAPAQLSVASPSEGPSDGQSGSASMDSFEAPHPISEPFEPVLRGPSVSPVTAPADQSDDEPTEAPNLAPVKAAFAESPQSMAGQPPESDVQMVEEDMSGIITEPSFAPEMSIKAMVPRMEPLVVDTSGPAPNETQSQSQGMDDLDSVLEIELGALEAL